MDMLPSEQDIQPTQDNRWGNKSCDWFSDRTLTIGTNKVNGLILILQFLLQWKF